MTRMGEQPARIEEWGNEQKEAKGAKDFGQFLRQS